MCNKFNEKFHTNMLYFETFYHLSNYEGIYASLFLARQCNSSHSKHIYELFILK